MSFELAPENQQGEFNQAVAYQYRLHLIFLRLDNATINKNYEEQYLLLRGLFKELYPVMNPKERERQKILKSQAIQSINNYRIAQRKGMKMMGGLLEGLDEWELDLRDITQHHNMLMPIKKDSRYAVG